MFHFQTDNKGVTRIVIEGEPGSGKTTFMKEVCRAWVTAVQKEQRNSQTSETDEQSSVQIYDEGRNNNDIHENNNTEDAENRYIAKYKVLLAFILRRITTEQTLMGVLMNQFPFLTCSELFEIEKILQYDPGKVCIFFDGLDEFKGKGFDPEKKEIIELIDVITGKAQKRVLGVTTTRSLGVIQLQRYNATAIQAHVKLCGFNKEQIKEYICHYFKLKKDANPDMFNAITEQNLLDIASIPIRLQMMCFVWKIFRKLGKSMADLYKLLLKGLLDHMEKRNKLKLTPEEEIMEKYHESILLPTAKLANRWDKHGNLEIIFPFADIGKVAEEYEEKVKNFGCITKYFSSSPMKNILWNFTHLSLQEFFVAYHVAHSETGLGKFVNKCFSVRGLEKYQLIMEFLCALAPEKSNEIIRPIITQTHEETDCNRLLNIVLCLMAAYDSLSSVDIPLPAIVSVGVSFQPDSDAMYVKDSEKRKTFLSHLLETDFKNDKNMTMMKIFDLDEFPDNGNISYLKGLFIIIDKSSNVNKAKSIVAKLSNQIIRMELVFFDSMEKTQMNEILDCIGSKSISSFCIKGPGIISVAASIIKEQQKLEILKVHDTNIGASVPCHDVQSMCDEANRSQTLRELTLIGPLLDRPLTSLSKHINLTVCSTQVTKFVADIIPHSPNIAEVDFSSVPISSGKELARTMILQSLVVLKLRQCGITPGILSQAEKEIRSSKKQPKLQQLDLMGNELEVCSDLHGLLDCCPNLELLLFSYKKKSEFQMNHSKLDMMVATGSKHEPTVLYFSENLHRLHQLFLIYNVPDFSQAKKQGIYQLSTLYILNVPDQYYEYLKSLSRNIQYMKHLMELYFTTTSTQILNSFEHFLELIKSLPSSMAHLNICGYDSPELTHILNEKHKFQNFQKLNIGSRETSKHTIQIIFQEMQQINPTISVYCDPEECLNTIITKASINPPADTYHQSRDEAKKLLEVLGEN